MAPPVLASRDQLGAPVRLFLIRGSPHPVDREDVESVVLGVGAGSGAERNASGEAITEGLSELAQALELLAGDAFVRLDLEGQHPTVVELGDEVDLVTVVSAPVPVATRSSSQDTCLRSSPTTQVSSR